MTGTELLVLIGFILFLSVICFFVIQRIGRNQELDWKDFVKEHPHLFKRLKK